MITIVMFLGIGIGIAANPTCDNIDGSGTAFDSGSCDSGYHLKPYQWHMCGTATCASSDCCEANPTCNNIHGSTNPAGGMSFDSGSCDSGYHLKDDLSIMCGTGTCASSDCCDLANTCTCADGTAATGANCVNDNDATCSSCNGGFHLNSDDASCVANTCTCDDGKPATGADCVNDNDATCSSCYGGFHLNSDDACEANTCTCADGTAATGLYCMNDNDATCSSCNGGFHLNSDDACEDCDPVCKTEAVGGVPGDCYYQFNCAGLTVSAAFSQYSWYYESGTDDCNTDVFCPACEDSACTDATTSAAYHLSVASVVVMTSLLATLRC